MSTPERNARCPCGSGKKYKQCCMRKQTRAQTPLPLRMRQVVSLSRSAASAISPHQTKIDQPDPAQQAPIEDPFKMEESSPPPEPPASPNYDSLMERVFGAACLDTKAHLKVKKEEVSNDPLKPETESET